MIASRAAIRSRWSAPSTMSCCRIPISRISALTWQSRYGSWLNFGSLTTGLSLTQVARCCKVLSRRLAVTCHSGSHLLTYSRYSVTSGTRQPAYKRFLLMDSSSSMSSASPGGEIAAARPAARLSIFHIYYGGCHSATDTVRWAGQLECLSGHSASESCTMSSASPVQSLTIRVWSLRPSCGQPSASYPYGSRRSVFLGGASTRNGVTSTGRHQMTRGQSACCTPGS